jgi:putative transposase
MARLARVVVPGLPHHVTQRGNGRAKAFFSEDDYRLVHLILIPKTADGLSKAMSLTHRSYASIINARQKKTGHFWQGRFGCVVMDGAHHMAALRYLLLNPVRAGLVSKPEDWPWSSAGALLKSKPDALTDAAGVTEQFGSIRTLLGEMPQLDMLEAALRRAETIGRPLGDVKFLDRLERKLDRPLKALKRGPKAKDEEMN